MDDREKVIKGLEVCSSIADGESCPKDCPYYQDVCYGYDQLMRDALALLKEQKAVKPVLVGRMWECGYCYAPVGIYLDDRRDDFCRKCGKKVQWDG